MRAVLLSFHPIPTYQHDAANFKHKHSPFRNTFDDDDDSDEGGDAEVALKVLPMIEGSAFSLPRIEFKGVGWRPRVGHRLGQCS